MSFSLKKLGDLVDIGSSKRIYATEYVNKGIPFFRSKEIIEKSNSQAVSQKLYISEERYLEIKEKFGVPEQGDLLLTSVGTLGVPYIVKDERFYFKDGNLTWFKNYRGLVCEYLYYWFYSPQGKSEINKRQIGSTQKALTISDLNEFEIALPSKSEQQAIVNVLSSLDDKIETNNKIIANLEAQAQAIFKSWFVDFEPFQDGEFVESELGMIPKGWEVVKANDWFTINIGKTPPRKESQWFSSDEKDIAWLSISDMANLQTYIVKTSEYLTQEAVGKFNVRMAPANSILLSFKLTVGRVGITRAEMTTNEAISHFHINYIYELYFLYLYLKMFNYAELGNTSSIGNAINSKIIKAMPILKPNEKTLKDFHSLIEPFFNLIYTLVTQNQNLTQIRDTLLPKLMSGEIKVGQAEVEEIENPL